MFILWCKPERIGKCKKYEKTKNGRLYCKWSFGIQFPSVTDDVRGGLTHRRHLSVME